MSLHSFWTHSAYFQSNGNCNFATLKWGRLLFVIFLALAQCTLEVHLQTCSNNHYLCENINNSNYKITMTEHVRHIRHLFEWFRIFRTKSFWNKFIWLWIVFWISLKSQYRYENGGAFFHRIVATRHCITLCTFTIQYGDNRIFSKCFYSHK